MKSIVEKINESIVDTTLTGLENNDMFTREYNNLFANMSGTLLRKVDVIIDRPVYVLTGTALRNGVQFLSSYDIAVRTLGKNVTPCEFLREKGYALYDADGFSKNLWPCCTDDSAAGSAVENALDPVIVSAVADMIDDEDYLIVA